MVAAVTLRRHPPKWKTYTPRLRGWFVVEDDVDAWNESCRARNWLRRGAGIDGGEGIVRSAKARGRIARSEVPLQSGREFACGRGVRYAIVVGFTKHLSFSASCFLAKIDRLYCADRN